MNHYMNYIIDKRSINSYNITVNKRGVPMKNLLNKFTFSENTRRIITYILYAIFTIYTIVNMIKEPSAAGKSAYLILLVIVMGIALWAEYLRILYHKMIRSLSMDCDPDKARHYYHILKKKDILKSYRQTLVIFDTLYYQDVNQPETCIQILEENEKFFKSSLDYLLIRNYTYFYSYYKMGNRTKVKKYYPEVMKLKGAKIKGSKVNPLYNWEMLEGVYLLASKEYKKSIQAFGNVNTKYMNMRELTQYYTDYGKAYMELKDKENAVIMFTKAIEIGKQLSYGKEARKCMNKL